MELPRAGPRDAYPEVPMRSSNDTYGEGGISPISSSFGHQHDSGSNNNNNATRVNSRRVWVDAELAKRRQEYVETKRLQLFGTTWNVNGHRPSDRSVEEWLRGDGLRTPDDMYDVYMIGIQEVQNLSGMSAVTTDPEKGKTWKHAIERALETLGDSRNRYSCVCARQMVGILLLIYVREELEQHLRDIMMIDVGTGFLNMGGNKGAVAARFTLRNVAISCVSSHLAAHEKNVDRRNQDFHEVIRRAVFQLPRDESDPLASSATATASDPASASTGRAMSIMDHDVVFWMGDLNYRISISRDEVLGMIQTREFEELSQYDQLTIARRGGRVLQGFEEGPLDFAPTYKYDVATPEYSMDDDGGVKRTPSWCDRILWRVRRSDEEHFVSQATGLNVKQGRYGRGEVFGSDHRPVFAVFDLEYGLENISKKNEIANEAHRVLDIREENARPQLRLSSNEVYFPSVEFNEEAIETIRLTNVGNVPCRVKVLWEDFPPWLRVDFPGQALDEELMPGEFIDAQVAVLVTTAADSSAISFGEEDLSATVRLHLVGGCDHFVFVSGTYVRTCFGVSLEKLVRAKQPFASRDKNALCGPEEATAGIPVELWLLGDSLTRPRREVDTDRPARRGVDYPDVFTGRARREDVRFVRECIDARREIPADVDHVAVATCMLALIANLEDPVLSRSVLLKRRSPRSVTHGSSPPTLAEPRGLGRARGTGGGARGVGDGGGGGGGGASARGGAQNGFGVEGANAALGQLPPLKRNVFSYTVALAREHCDAAELTREERHYVAGILGQAFLGGRPGADLIVGDLAALDVSRDGRGDGDQAGSVADGVGGGRWAVDVNGLVLPFLEGGEPVEAFFV